MQASLNIQPSSTEFIMNAWKRPECVRSYWFLRSGYFTNFCFFLCFQTYFRFYCNLWINYIHMSTSISSPAMTHRVQFDYDTTEKWNEKKTTERTCEHNLQVIRIDASLYFIFHLCFSLCLSLARVRCLTRPHPIVTLKNEKCFYFSNHKKICSFFSFLSLLAFSLVSQRFFAHFCIAQSINQASGSVPVARFIANNAQNRHLHLSLFRVNGWISVC